MIKKILGVLLITSLVCSPVYAERITLQDGNGNEVGTAGNPLVVSGGSSVSDDAYGALEEIVVSEDAFGSMNTNVTAFGDETILTLANGYQVTAFFGAVQSSVTGVRYLNLCSRTTVTSSFTCYAMDGTGGKQTVSDSGTEDYHNVIGMGEDADGYVHIIYANHGDQLKYRVSIAPYDISNTGPNLGTNPGMLGTNEDQVTYPRFFNRPSDDKLYVTFRNGPSGNAIQLFYKFDIGTATSVTADSAADTFTATGHGLSNGNIVRIQGVSVPTGITSTQRYFVVNVSGDTFKVSATSGGAAVDFSTNGTSVTFTKYSWSAAVGAAGVLINPAGVVSPYIFGPPRWDSAECLHWAWSTRDDTDDIDVSYVKGCGSTFDTWTQGDGDAQTIPITENNDYVAVSVPDGEHLSSMNAIDVDGSDRPHIVFVEDDANDNGQIYHTYLSGGSWTTRQITRSLADPWPSDNTGSPSMKFPDLSRPEIAIKRDTGKVYIIYRDLTGPKGILIAESSTADLTSWVHYRIYNSEIGYWEASYDRDQWTENDTLYMPMSVVSEFSRASAPFSIVKWNPSTGARYPYTDSQRGSLFNKGDVEVYSKEGDVRIGAGGGDVYMTSSNATNTQQVTLHVDKVQGDPYNDYASHIFSANVLSLLGANTELLFTWVSPATTEIDMTGRGHIGTYQGSMTTSDQEARGYLWELDFDGTNDFVSVADSTDFSFGDGSTDSAFSVRSVAEVLDSGNNQAIITKRDNASGAEAREWSFALDATEKTSLALFDESANVSASRKIDTALTAGSRYFLCGTYAGTGGTTAANGMTIYTNGVAVASTATNNASYVAMENLATEVRIGALDNGAGNDWLMTGNLGAPMIFDKELTAQEVWRLWCLVRGNFNLD